GATHVCNTNTINGSSGGVGTQEYSSSTFGCLVSGEHRSNWYYFQAQTAGTLAFTITSANSTDIDFALWGPYASYTCPVSGAPLRCSYAVPNASYTTGLNSSSVDRTEGAGGDAFVATVSMTAGSYYILLVDIFGTL